MVSVSNLDPKKISLKLVMGKAVNSPGYTSTPSKDSRTDSTGTSGKRGNGGAEPRGLAGILFMKQLEL